jgi:hypothetical protein
MYSLAGIILNASSGESRTRSTSTAARVVVPLLTVCRELVRTCKSIQLDAKFSEICRGRVTYSVMKWEITYRNQ